jgi:hypothetical protein
VHELGRILILRYGLAGEVPRTLQEVETRLGIPRERVRQLDEQALGETPTGAELRRRARLAELPSTSLLEADDRPPICPRCGVTMVPAALSADDNREGDWVCLECEELDNKE